MFLFLFSLYRVHKFKNDFKDIFCVVAPCMYLFHDIFLHQLGTTVFFIQVTVAPRISKTHSHNLEDGNQQKLPKNGSNRTIFRKLYHLWNLFLQSIVESPTGQLKLGEIYSWFSNNFKHFRTTCNLTWKVILRSYLTFFVCQPFSSSVSSNLWTFDSYLPCKLKSKNWKLPIRTST